MHPTSFISSASKFPGMCQDPQHVLLAEPPSLMAEVCLLQLLQGTRRAGHYITLHYITAGVSGSKVIHYSHCKTDLRTCKTFTESWKSQAMNCAAWHHNIYKGITEAGIMRGLLAVESRDRKKRALASLATQASQFICTTSNSDCPSGHSRWCQDLINI